MTLQSGNPREQEVFNSSVNVKQQTFSVGIFLLCLLLPFFSPLVALIRGKWIAFIVILLLFVLCFGLSFIPVLGWFLILIIDIFVAVHVAKGASNVQVQVNNTIQKQSSTPVPSEQKN